MRRQFRAIPGRGIVAIKSAATNTSVWYHCSADPDLKIDMNQSTEIGLHCGTEEQALNRCESNKTSYLYCNLI